MKLTTLRKLHKWVALVVGIQLLLWTVSGLVFAVLDHEAVSGARQARIRESLRGLVAACPSHGRVEDCPILNALQQDWQR